MYDGLFRFLTATPTPSLAFLDPFAMLSPLLDEVIKSCDKNTWTITKKVRQVEKVWNIIAYKISNCYLKVK